jgi:hypothetical protein
MQFCNGIIEAIGNTPLIKLERVSNSSPAALSSRGPPATPVSDLLSSATLWVFAA